MLAASALTGVLPAAADSARVVEHVYAVSLSALVPLGIAGIATMALRRSQAASRAAVLRAAVIALLIVYLGALLPVHRVAWIVPAGLAAPLIALGRMQMGAPLAKLLASESLAGGGESMTVRLALALYVTGSLVVLLPLGLAAARLALQTRRAVAVVDQRVLRLFAAAKWATGVHRDVRLVASNDVGVPMTWGMLRPAILLPSRFVDEPDDRLRAVLLHELGHVSAGDATFMMLSRLCRALLWFHPGVWWLDSRLRAACEMACDDRVLAHGVRQSDYAELLVDACDRSHTREEPGLALAICHRAGLRERLVTILDPARDLRRRSRLAAGAAVSLMMMVAVPASLIQLAPTKSVLDSLMRDHRWESRAYAVFGLAQRPDSIEVARSAAAMDPDPKVRAWARYAVSLELTPATARARSAR